MSRARRIIEDGTDDRLDAAFYELSDPEVLKERAQEIIAEYLLTHKDIDERILAYMRDMVDDLQDDNPHEFNLEYAREGAAEMATETVILDELGDVPEPLLTMIWDLLKERYVELAEQARIGDGA
jgi:hypothetical protein